MAATQAKTDIVDIRTEISTVEAGTVEAGTVDTSTVEAGTVATSAVEVAPALEFAEAETSNPVRGILVGVALSIPMWVGVIVAIRMVVRALD